MTTLEIAKQKVEDNLEAGTICPCCQQFVKSYKRKINSGMARTLIYIYNYYVEKKGITEYFHVERFGVDHRYPIAHDFSLLRFWNLIEPFPDKKEDGNKSGEYRITKKGLLFVEGKIQVSKYIFVYNNSCKGFSEEQVSIKSCLGQKFDFSELMSYKTFAGDVILDSWIRQGMQFKQVEDGWYECSSDSGDNYRCHPFSAICTCPSHKFAVKRQCKHLAELYERLKTQQAIKDLDESKIQRSEI